MPSPPPPLILHRNDLHPRRASDPLNDTITTPLVARDRQPSRPIPIEGLTPPTGPHAYSLESHESTISDLSDSLRASPPPLTTTSALPTPYTIRTPASTETSSSSTVQQPIVASPFSPSASHHGPLSPSGTGLVRAKSSFPHNGDLLGSRGEASSSRSSHIAAESGFQEGEGEGEEVGVPMEIDQDRDATIRDQGEAVRETAIAPPQVHSSSPSGSGSLTRLLQDIGGRPSSSPSLPRAHPQPNPPSTATVREFPDWSRSGPPRSNVHPDYHPGYNALGWVAPQAHLAAAASSATAAGSMTSRLSTHTAAARSVSGSGSGDASSGTRGSSAARDIPTGGLFASPPVGAPSVSRIAPVRSSSARDASSRSSLPSDFRTLPSPISNVPSSGSSPGALERRIDNIEARLERARSGRGLRSPPTPPAPFAGHAYEGLRIRPNAARPYDPPPTRQRHFGTSLNDDGLFGRSAATGPSSQTRSPWSDNPSTSATVPPPRPTPLAPFGWEPTPRTEPPAAHDAASRLLIQSLIEADSEGGTISPIPRPDSPSTTTTSDVTSRPWYLQQRMNMLDSMRSGASAPTAAARPISQDWSDFEVHGRPDFSPDLRREGSDASDESISFRHAFGVGLRDRAVHTPVAPFGMGWNFDERLPADVAPNPIRPANRRWMSFDENERESSRERSRERERDRAAGAPHEGDSIGALNRDINEAVGRRLSQVRPRPRSSSITRRLRDQLGPDWEDARVINGETVLGSRIEDDNRPAQRQRTDGGSDSGRSHSLWGELPRVDAANFGGPRFDSRPGGREWLDAYVAPPSSSSSRDRSTTTGSPADELAAFIERRTRNRTGHADLGGTGHRFGLEDAESIFLERLRAHEPFFTRPYRQDLAEGVVDLSSDTPPAFAYLNTLRRMHAATGPPLSSIKFTPEMSEDEKGKIVQMVIRGMARLPAAPRKKAAEGVLEILPWGQFGQREGMERDEYCSVCHDEYDDEVKIAVTPCKHMYHKDCLDTWLNTPNHSSCPMCRRDLAALACLTKMTPSKTVEEALPLWMNAAL
ncbi:hypothetical protein IAU59_001331 [Kwoniella sp. CBS 9459]